MVILKKSIIDIINEITNTNWTNHLYNLNDDINIIINKYSNHNYKLLIEKFENIKVILLNLLKMCK